MGEEALHKIAGGHEDEDGLAWKLIRFGETERQANVDV